MHRRPMLLIAVALVGLAIASALALAEAIRSYEASASVYSLSQVQDGLAQHPKEWLGRVVSLRARIVSMPVPVGTSPTDPSISIMGFPLLPSTSELPAVRRSDASLVSGMPGRGSMLVLVHGDEESVLRALRHAPLIGRMVPRLQALDFFHDTTYRVQLQAAPTTSMACLTAPCYQAVLLDAASWPSLRYTNFLH